MKKINLLLAALVCGCTAFAGDLYDDLANTPEQLKKWQGNLKVAKLLPNGGPEGKYAVEINCDKNTQYGIIRFNLPVDKVKGKKVEISAKVKAEKIYSEDANTITFTAVITDIKEKNYARDYTPRAYAILSDGTVI